VWATLHVDSMVDWLRGHPDQFVLKTAPGGDLEVGPRGRRAAGLCVVGIRILSNRLVDRQWVHTKSNTPCEQPQHRDDTPQAKKSHTTPPAPDDAPPADGTVRGPPGALRRPSAPGVVGASPAPFPPFSRGSPSRISVAWDPQAEADDGIITDYPEMVCIMKCYVYMIYHIFVLTRTTGQMASPSSSFFFFQNRPIAVFHGSTGSVTLCPYR